MLLIALTCLAVLALQGCFVFDLLGDSWWDGH
jgi:hypothetical protein